MSEIKSGTTLPKLWDDSSLRPYLGEISRRHGIIETLALPSMRDLPPLRIETLFVQPLLAEKQVSADSDPEGWPEGKSLLETLQEHPQLVVLGDPGSGKTTLSNWLAWRLSAGLTSPLPPALENRVPLPCVLREIPSEIFKPGTTLAELAASIADRLLEAGEALITSLRARVDAGNYVLILDGVDEIPVPHRRTVAEWAKQAQSQNACVLATSRIVGYEDWPVDRFVFELSPTSGKFVNWKDLSHLMTELEVRAFKRIASTPPLIFSKSKNFENFTLKQLSTLSLIGSTTWAQLRYLMPFDQGRIAAFVENWYRQRCGSEQEARQKSKDLLASLAQSDVTRQLARTPNLLGLMAIVHRERAHLPDGKALLYDEIANAYINTIDKQRKIMPGDSLAAYGWKERRAWLAYVGFQMQQLRSGQQKKNKKTEDGVLASEEAVLTWLTEAMQLAAVNQPRESAKTFLGWVARRSGLLLPRGEGRYAFVHLSFQEYFCACYLHSRIVSPAFVRNNLKDDDPVTRPSLAAWSQIAAWRETLVYLFELLSAEQGGDWVDDLTEILFPPAKGNMDFDEDQAALTGRLLTDKHIRLGETWKDRLAERCLKQAFSDWSNRQHLEGGAVLPALIDTGYAAIIAKPSDEADTSLNLGKPALKFSSLQEIATQPKLRLCVLAIKDFSDVAPLAKLSSLQWLHLDNTQVADIAPLARLSSLQQLSLNNTKVADIAPLAKLSSLQWLQLDNTQVADIAPLAKLSSLQQLSLNNTQVADVTPLAKLNNLWWLNLESTQITDITPLAGLSNLYWLYLNGTQVADVAPLAKLNNLWWLNLENTQVTDVAPLAGIKMLQIYGMPSAESKPVRKKRKSTKP